jgi:fructosamine-3-kinase
MSVAAAVWDLTGQKTMYTSRLQGGDLSDVLRLTFEDQTTCIAKIGPHVAVEARMLEALATAQAPVPDVMGVQGDVLLLEDLGEANARSQADPALWEGLADALQRQHAARDTHYGWAEDYAFGSVPIPGGWCADWPTFWVQKRLMADPGALPPDIARRIEALALRLPDILPATPQASMLHGDLWLGNLHMTHAQAWLIDPACFYGHSEVDLAFLHLFGRPHDRFTQRHPAPEPRFELCRAAYQLWPALVHLRLFGPSYRGMVTQLLERLGA